MSEHIPTQASTPGCRSDELADEVLVRVTLQDQQAFGSLDERYAVRVYRYARM